jgi:hypothetical protein
MESSTDFTFGYRSNDSLIYLFSHGRDSSVGIATL